MRAAPDLPLVTWRQATELRGLTHPVGTVLADSLDASDVAASAPSTEGAATVILSPPAGFSQRREWWQMVVYDNPAAGFVLPVTYDGGLDEATI